MFKINGYDNLKSNNNPVQTEEIKKIIGLSQLRDKKLYIENKMERHKSWINNFVFLFIGFFISIISGELRWLGIILVLYSLIMIIEHLIRKAGYKEVYNKAEEKLNSIEENLEIPDDINDFVDNLTEEIKQVKIEILHEEGLITFVNKLFSEQVR